MPPRAVRLILDQGCPAGCDRRQERRASRRNPACMRKMVSPNQRPFAIIVAREVHYNSDQRPGASMDVKLETERLVLRGLRPDDASTIARLAGRREIADTTLSIPHPYSEEQAQEWIGTHGGPQNPPRRWFSGSRSEPTAN